MLRPLPRLRYPAFALALVAMASILAAQGGPPAPPRGPVLNGSSDPLLAPFRFRSIGPASMGGRIDDIAVSESDPNIIYVGYAVGGVFKSENNGTTFEPVFQSYATASIGDIAIHPTNPSIVYVGTGEPNNRQTTSFGDGIYKTTDGGRSFSNIGLRETQSIARIVIDPRNPEVVYVAAPGHLFGPNPDRGIYKTTDGGQTWNSSSSWMTTRGSPTSRSTRRTATCCMPPAIRDSAAAAALAAEGPAAPSGRAKMRGEPGLS